VTGLLCVLSGPLRISKRVTFCSEVFFSNNGNHQTQGLTFHDDWVQFTGDLGEK
jgi:hypothetical protein